MRISLRLRVLLGLLALLVPATAVTGAAHADGDGDVSVAISQVDLDGPTIADVTVTVTNDSPSRMSKVAVELSGPTGWLVHPSRQELTGSIRPGDSWSAPFRMQVPEQRSGFRTHTFVATVTYRGGDGAGTAIGRRVQRTGEALPDLAAGRDNVGITSESDPAPGNFDGDGNSFSAEKLADVGLTPGGTVAALGATFTWPDVPPGTPDNVRAAGQGIELDGEGSHIAFLGSGSSLSAVGTATVLYTDGTTSSGTLGFPNWSFQEADAHGATLVASSTGRNRQSGYGDAAYAYRVFAHAIPVDPGKTVDVVVLPGNASIHVFDLELVD